MQHRVKVYRLGDKGQWLDKGVGHALIEDNAATNSRSILVVRESRPGETSTEDPQPLLFSRILPAISYKRQGKGTIITWNDPEIEEEVAMSFEHKAGCDHIWKEMEAYLSQAYQQAAQQQHRHQNRPLPQQQQQQQQQQPTMTGMIDEVAMERDELSGAAHMAQGQMAAASQFVRVDIPDLQVGNLPAIGKLLTELHPCHREGVAAQLRESDFLKTLVEIFHMLEDVEDTQSLHHVNAIMKALVMLNDPPILETLFDDNVILDTIGMLEYDSSFPEKQNHREILLSEIKFKEVVPIGRAQVVGKIHQTFKISYIKDTILPIVLDDATFGTLSSIILYNNVEILQALASDPNFFVQLFDKMKTLDRKAHAQEWAHLVDFLQEICDHAKHLQVQQRHALFLSLIKLGLFNLAGSILRDDDDSLRLKGMDVMMSTLQHDPALLRHFLLQQEQGESTLLMAMIETLVSDSETGLQEQMGDVLRMLLDPESLQPNVKDGANNFWDIFYQKYFGRVVDVLNESSSPSTLVLVLDLLCFCVHVHSMWIKYFILRNKVIDKVANLMRRKEKVVVLAALRMLRVCVGLKDDFYQTQIIQTNALAPGVDAFLANGERYNMVNSAFLELFDFIRRENLKSLAKYVVEKFWDAGLSAISYVTVFREIKMSHDQSVQSESLRMAPRSGAVGGAQPGPQDKVMMAEMRLNRMRKRRDGSMDKEEEDYFESDDGGGENQESQPGASLGDDRGPPGALERAGGVASGSRDMEMDEGRGTDVGGGRKITFQVSPGLAGRVIISPNAPLLLNSLVDYDLLDTDNSSAQPVAGAAALFPQKPLKPSPPSPPPQPTPNPAEETKES